MAEPRLDGVSVLVVDDHQDSREAYAFRLAQVGAEVWTASDASDAFGLLTTGLSLSVILSDFHVPGTDGAAFLSGVRDLGFGMPAVAVTADITAIDSLISAGFDACLVKPVSGGVVAETVARS